MSDYKTWLEGQGYGLNTVQSQTARKTKVESIYGPLDLRLIEKLLLDLRYSAEDARLGRPDPSKLHIGGDIIKGLASYRSALKYYARYLSASANASEPIAEEVRLADDLEPEYRERIGLERDLQSWLRRSIASIESGLVITDDGAERAVSSGFIDITARDERGAAVVIELKADRADRNAVGQILSYMGDVTEEEGGVVRGILVAHDFTDKARAAARVVPNLSLRRYAIRFDIDED